jgi:TrmH family RNA methyltransferase
MMKTISSIKDEKIVLARTVRTRKGRDEHNQVLLEGEQVLDWALENGIKVEYILFTDQEQSTVAEKYLKQNIAAFKVSDGIQKKVTDKSYVIPIVGVGKIPKKASTLSSEFVVVLDDVKDYGNIGTIIRTCHAFGIREIVSTSREFDLYQRKTIEASRGSVFSTSITKYENGADTIQDLRKNGYQIVVTSPRGSSLQSLVELKPKPVALIVGNESQGVSWEFEDQADILIQIPMSETIESLNVGVATGISVYELKLKQVMSMIEQQIKSTLGRELNVAGMLVQRALDAELKKVSDLNSQQVIFMMVLKCDREMTVEDMCRQFGVLDTEAHEFLEILTKKGLVDQGEKLQLTIKGEEVLGKLWFTVESTERKILSGCTEAETRVLKRQLHQIQENCIQMMSGN